MIKLKNPLQTTLLIQLCFELKSLSKVSYFIVLVYFFVCLSWQFFHNNLSMQSNTHFECVRIV